MQPVSCFSCMDTADPPVLWQGVIKPVWSAALCGENTMLHAECCEKGVHRWVPRCCAAPGPIARSAEHANEVIMLCLTLCFCLSFTVWALCLSQEAGHPCDAANHTWHIWHNEETRERCSDGDEELLCVFQANIQSHEAASVIYIHNKASLKENKKRVTTFIC